LFIGSAIGNVQLEKLIVEIIPFIIMQFIILIMISYIPFMSLAIPKYFGF
jgi:TRAP-type C4-dicarboxylate transport system permease large subunit